jgi:hypothetical protein
MGGTSVDAMGTVFDSASNYEFGYDHYKNAEFYITHFHLLGIRPKYNFHLRRGNTKESRSLCYGGTC